MLYRILALIQASVRVYIVHAQKPVLGRQTHLPIPKSVYQIETSPYTCLFDLLLLGLMTTHKRLFSGNRLGVAQRHQNMGSLKVSLKLVCLPICSCRFSLFVA